MIRIYYAPQIGTGTDSDPFRSILNYFIDCHSGDCFDEIDDPIKHMSICTVHASQGVHDKIYADRDKNPGRITYMSELYGDDDKKKTGMAVKWSDLKKEFKDAFDAKLSTATKIKKDSTLKDALKIAIDTIIDNQADAMSVTKKTWAYNFAGEQF